MSQKANVVDTGVVEIELEEGSLQDLLSLLCRHLEREKRECVIAARNGDYIRFLAIVDDAHADIHPDLCCPDKSVIDVPFTDVEILERGNLYDKEGSD